jgi:hypothetical protein
MTSRELTESLARLGEDARERWVEYVYCGEAYQCVERVGDLIGLLGRAPEGGRRMLVDFLPEPHDGEMVTPCRVARRRRGMYGKPAVAVHWRLVESDRPEWDEAEPGVAWLKEGF